MVLKSEELSDADNKKYFITTSPEELLSVLLGKGGDGLFNNNRARSLLESLNETVNNTFQSLNNIMAAKDDF
ncbi:MAG: hypothetical protein ACHQIM_11785 [Sphingobacteriales bacterium]